MAGMVIIKSESLPLNPLTGTVYLSLSEYGMPKVLRNGSLPFPHPPRQGGEEFAFSLPLSRGGSGWGDFVYYTLALHCFGERGAGFLQGEDLRRIARDELIFCVGRNNLDRHVLESGKEDPLSLIAFQ